MGQSKDEGQCVQLYGLLGDHGVSLCVTVSLGTVPSGDAPKGLPLFEEDWEDTDSMGCKAGIFP